MPKQKELKQYKSNTYSSSFDVFYFLCINKKKKCSIVKKKNYPFNSFANCGELYTLNSPSLTPHYAFFFSTCVRK